MTDSRLWRDQRADGGAGQLLDCGHVGAFAGVCQYKGCAKRLCADCMASCEACGEIVCRAHQVWLDDRQRVFCSPDARRHLAKQLALRMLGRDHDA